MNDESAVLIQNFQKICLMQRDKLKILKKYAYALKQGANCKSRIQMLKVKCKLFQFQLHYYKFTIT